MRYLFQENNSGGYKIAMSCLGRKPDTKNATEKEYVMVEADNVNEAVEKFDKHFEIDSDNESSYEGGSCNCCGRRFTIKTDDEKAEGEYKGKYTNVYHSITWIEYILKDYHNDVLFLK